MILYYAMGGGFGHLTRAFAIIRKSDFLRSSVRILTSSTHAELTLSAAHCPVDIMQISETVTSGTYFRIIDDYISKHHFNAIIIDSFPFGIAGELSHIAINLPRIMICRHLKWAEYLERIGSSRGPYPSACLLLEELDKAQLSQLGKYGDLTSLRIPVADREISWGGGDLNNTDWLIIHSGNSSEQNQLLAFTRKVQSECGCDGEEIMTIFPEHGIYPAHEYICSAKHVISAGGYNMTAAAALAPEGRVHYLHPFQRRFDDQHLRVERFRAGILYKERKNGVIEAAKWAEKALMAVCH